VADAVHIDNAGAPVAGMRVLVATRPVGFRKGAHGLAALAAEALMLWLPKLVLPAFVNAFHARMERGTSVHLRWEPMSFATLSVAAGLRQSVPFNGAGQLARSGHLI
jgi:hypothetical protein